MTKLSEPQERLLAECVLKGMLPSSRWTGPASRALERRGLITIENCQTVMGKHTVYSKIYRPTEAGATAAAEAVAFLRPIHGDPFIGLFQGAWTLWLQSQDDAD